MFKVILILYAKKSEIIYTYFMHIINNFLIKIYANKIPYKLPEEDYSKAKPVQSCKYFVILYYI